MRRNEGVERWMVWVGLPDGSVNRLVLVESKSSGRATTADRWLWSAGHGPLSLSKYCLGLALLDASLPANKWHRALGRSASNRL
ncbi:MAG: hypothetical protein ACRDV9_00635 [Acidimicrobiia bacterium]